MNIDDDFQQQCTEIERAKALDNTAFDSYDTS